MKRILALILILILLFAGCSPAEVSESSAEASVLLESVSRVWDNKELAEQAKQLLKADRLITDLFVGGKMTQLVDVSGKNATDSIPATGTEYEDFSVIEKLLTSTYSEASGISAKFLAFPKYGTKSISNVEGKTHFSFHYTEEYASADLTAVTVSDGSSNNQKVITAGNYTLNMVYDGSIWLLDNSIYFLQKNTSAAESTILFPNMNQGSAKTLSGNILVVEIFISDTKNKFSDADITAFDTKIKESFGFLSTVASSYEDTVKPDFKKLLYTHKSSINFTANEPYAFDFILAETSYKNLDKYIADNFDITTYDSYVAILCVNKNGTGFAKPYCENDTDAYKQLYYNERCVFFASDDSTSLARNILLLFGAQTQTDANLIQRMTNYCPNELLLGNAGIDTALLSELTAYQAGITKKLDKQFLAFYTAPAGEAPAESTAG